MNRIVLFAALAATSALCAGLALREDDEIAAARPLPAGRSYREAAGAEPADRRPAAGLGPAGGSRLDDWPPAPAATLAAWSASASAASGPAAAGAPAAAVVQRPVAVAVNAAPAPPPPPRAPAFGFELIGTVLEGQGRGALIQTPQRSLWVRVGDTVDGAWRVEQVRADSVELTWLPQQLPAALRYRAP